MPFISLGQEARWSQPQTLPVLMNPARAGFEADYRASAHYKSSWASVTAPFRTVAASFDMRVSEKGNRRKDAEELFQGLGAGLSFFNDRTGDPVLATTRVDVQVSYHVKINENTSLGGGLTAGYDQRSIDLAAGKWASQFNGHAYDPGIPSGESFAGDSESHIQLGAGMTYHYRSTPSRGHVIPTSVAVGVAAHHPGRVRLSDADFISGELSPRYSLIGEGEFPISESSALGPSVYVHQQGGDTDVMLGTSFKQLLVYGNTFIRSLTESSMSVGVFYRHRQAVILQGHLNFGEFGAGISYDLNVSDLSEYTGRKGGFELSVRWRHHRDKR